MSQDAEAILRRLLELQDRQQQVIAYEIHDGLVQEIVAAKMEAEAILASAHCSPPLRELLERLIRRLGGAVDEARRLVGNLRPLPLHADGWLEALRQWAQQLAVEQQFFLEIRVDATIPALDAEISSSLTRMVREAVVNALRHSGTDQAEVRVGERLGQFCIEVRDRGVGFDPRAVPAGRYGLESIRQRARLLGGDAVIESRPGEGTRIQICLPATSESAGGGYPPVF